MFKNQDYTRADRLLDKYAYMVNFRGFFYNFRGRAKVHPKGHEKENLESSYNTTFIAT